MWKGTKKFLSWFFILFAVVCFWSIYEQGGPAGQWIGGIGAFAIFVLVARHLFRKEKVEKQAAAAVKQQTQLNDLSAGNLVTDQLVKLSQLHASGVLSDQEFTSFKAKLVNQLGSGQWSNGVPKT